MLTYHERPINGYTLVTLSRRRVRIYRLFDPQGAQIANAVMLEGRDHFWPHREIARHMNQTHKPS